jgi:AcrR family transcriptional regulator
MHDAGGPVKSRREQYSAATRTALLDSATALFAEKGFSATALSDVAATAQVTRGAVYHHFADKQALFEAVLERLEVQAMQGIAGAAVGGGDAWDASMRGLAAFLDQCLDPVYSRIVWREGPAALGWQRWRECEHEYGYGLTEQFLRALAADGQILPVQLKTTTRLVFAMLGESGLALAEVEEGARPELREELESVLYRILDGLRVPSDRSEPHQSRHQPG